VTAIIATYREQKCTTSIYFYGSSRKIGIRTINAEESMMAFSTLLVPDL